MNIKILGIRYPVKFCDLQKQAANGNAGGTDTTQCRIFISNIVNSEVHAKSVLLHEVLETINYRLELDLKHNQITQLEAGLFSVLRDNPKFVEFICDKRSAS